MVKNKIRIIKFLFVALVLFFFGGGVSNAQSVTVSLPDLQGQAGKQVYIPVTISSVTNTPITSYGFSVAYDATTIVLDTVVSSYTDAASGVLNTSLTSASNLTVISGKGTSVINIGAYGMTSITTNSLPLVYIKAHYVASGVSNLTLQNGYFNSGSPAFVAGTTGKVTVASLTVSFPTVSIAANYHKGDVITIPITLNSAINSANVTSYQFKFNYDTTKIKFAADGVITTGTASAAGQAVGNFTATGNAGTGNVAFAQGSAISATDTILLKLKATILQRTSANNPITLKFTSFVFNTGSPTVATFDGSIYTVNRKPTIVATPKPAAINAGSALTITVAVADTDAEALVSYAQNIPTGGIVAAAYNATTGKFTWTPDYTQSRTAPYVVTFFATDGTDTVSVADSISVNGYAVNGKITYANAAKTPVKNVTVTIKKSDNTTVTAVSDTAGNYSFASLLQGTYILSYAKTDEFGGVNASDALAVLRYSVGLDQLSAIQLLAADVNNDGKVNGTDALIIIKRYVGAISSYLNNKADWSFLGTTSDTIAVTAGAVTHNVNALVSGDVNASYYGTVSKSIASSLTSNSVVKISPKASFEIPVTASMLSDLGSISMKIDYAANLANFAGLTANQELSNISYSNNVKDGVLSIAWVDMNVGKTALKLSDNSVLFTLKFTATDNFKNGSTFALKLEGTSELTTSTGAQIEKSTVSAPTVEVAVPASFSVKQNYPNPFNPSTTIAYDIPVSGHVSLTIFNLLGQKVATVLDQVQEAGAYKIVWDASKLASGTYIYTMTVDGANQKYVSNKKMILMK